MELPIGILEFGAMVYKTSLLVGCKAKNKQIKEMGKQTNKYLNLQAFIKATRA